ncbi:MAG TPA: class I SAM-dependent methyltransferase, partial [Chthonomonadaceae bacterium]|nr:class I SAM-dependent methyltransferase [Chthonomonadaceae bacterium]
APVMFDEARWGAAPEQVDQVLALLDVAPEATLLDLCCGPGRHSLELARRGFRVTGVDRTVFHLETARKGAQAENLNVGFVQEDMRRFCRPEAFDGAINLFTSFGYFADPADDRQVLENIHRSLKPGARLVMDVIGKEVLARRFRERHWSENNGVFILEEPKILQNWSWIETRWIVFAEGKKHAFTVSHRLYSAAELAALLEASGFAGVEIYGDLAGAPYDQNAKRLVAVATSPP